MVDPLLHSSCLSSFSQLGFFIFPKYFDSSLHLLCLSIWLSAFPAASLNDTFYHLTEGFCSNTGQALTEDVGLHIEG